MSPHSVWYWPNMIGGAVLLVLFLAIITGRFWRLGRACKQFTLAVWHRANRKIR